MPVNPLYAVGTTLVHRQDPGRTAEIIATKTLNGIEHYLIEVSPNHIHASPFWLSGFGLNRDFAPRGRRRGGDGADGRTLFGIMTRLIRGDDGPAPAT